MITAPLKYSHVLSNNLPHQTAQDCMALKSNCKIYSVRSIFCWAGLWAEVCRRLNMVQEKNDEMNKDMVLSPIQQNRPAVRTPPASLSPAVSSHFLHVNSSQTLCSLQSPQNMHSPMWLIVWCLQNRRTWFFGESSRSALLLWPIRKRREFNWIKLKFWKRWAFPWMELNLKIDSNLSSVC